MTHPLRSIRIEEAGCRSEIEELAGGAWWMSLEAPGGETTTEDVPYFETVCQLLDRWLARHVPPDAPGRFAGLVAEKWDHEERMAVTVRYLTRGSLLQVFDEDGSVPTLDGFIECMQGCGDRVLRVWDGGGTLLADRRVEVARELRGSVGCDLGFDVPRTEDVPGPVLARFVVRPQDGAPEGARGNLLLGAMMKGPATDLLRPGTVYAIREVLGTLVIEPVGDAAIALDRSRSAVAVCWGNGIDAILDGASGSFLLTHGEAAPRG